MTINKFLFVTAAIALVACCPKKPTATADNGTYQCMTANITVAGKPMTVLVEWNTQTGMARFLDSAIVTSKVTGAQNVLVGWVPLGELNQVIQEVLQRDQQQQQKAAAAPATLSLSNVVAEPPPAAPTGDIETHPVKSKK